MNQNDPQDWPPELDALIAAPEHHFLVLENDHVRLLETVIPPGETSPVHTYCWPAVFTIQSWSDFVRRDAGGKVTVDTRGNQQLADQGKALWSEPLPSHTLENVGDREIRLLSVEIKTHYAAFWVRSWRVSSEIRKKSAVLEALSEY